MRGVFDIIGPIMVGPSSSHTAGATRLGRMARTILGEQPVQAIIELHGSFALTYRGHGTDKAIAAGLLGMTPDDLNIRDALEISSARGLAIQFRTIELKDAHPNTAVIRLTGASGKTVKVVGASIGGGSILITEINGFKVELTGEYHTLITVHQDTPGVIATITDRLAREKVNIAFMRLSRRQRGSDALMILEADQEIPSDALQVVRSIPAVRTALIVPPLH